jgi:hypothetical protein
LLPAGVYPATLAEVRQRFVDQAPESTRERRTLIFEALDLHLKVVKRLFTGHDISIWLDGGFVTHKPMPPRDADIACLVPGAALSVAQREAALPLWTLADVTARWGGSGPVISTAKLHTLGGLTDAFVVNRDNVSNVELARRQFSQVLGSDRMEIASLEKGFVEVIFP